MISDDPFGMAFIRTFDTNAYTPGCLYWHGCWNWKANVSVLVPFLCFFAGHGSCSAAPMFTNILQSGVSVLPWFASYLNNSTQCVPGRLSLQYCTECHMLQFSNWSRSCCTLLTCCSWYNDIIIIHKRMLMTRKFTGPVIRLWLYRALILLNLALFRAPLCLRFSWCYYYMY